jgi:hypothetical protein
MSQTITSKSKYKKQKNTINNHAWFWGVRGSYLPANEYGWLTYIPFVAYLVFSLTVAIKDIHSALVAILVVIPNWVAAAVVMTYLAAKKS